MSRSTGSRCGAGRKDTHRKDIEISSVSVCITKVTALYRCGCAVVAESPFGSTQAGGRRDGGNPG